MSIWGTVGPYDDAVGPPYFEAEADARAYAEQAVALVAEIDAFYATGTGPTRATWWKASAYPNRPVECYEQSAWSFEMCPNLEPTQDGVLHGSNTRNPYYWCEAHDRDAAIAAVQRAVDAFNAGAPILFYDQPMIRPGISIAELNSVLKEAWAPLVTGSSPLASSR